MFCGAIRKSCCVVVANIKELSLLADGDVEWSINSGSSYPSAALDLDTRLSFSQTALKCPFTPQFPQDLLNAGQSR